MSGHCLGTALEGLFEGPESPLVEEYRTCLAEGDIGEARVVFAEAADARDLRAMRGMVAAQLARAEELDAELARRDREEEERREREDAETVAG